MRDGSSGEDKLKLLSEITNLRGSLPRLRSKLGTKLDKKLHARPWQRLLKALRELLEVAMARTEDEVDTLRAKRASLKRVEKALENAQQEIQHSPKETLEDASVRTEDEVDTLREGKR